METTLVAFLWIIKIRQMGCQQVECIKCLEFQVYQIWATLARWFKWASFHHKFQDWMVIKIKIKIRVCWFHHSHKCLWIWTRWAKECWIIRISMVSAWITWFQINTTRCNIKICNNSNYISKKLIKIKEQTNLLDHHSIISIKI